MDMKQKTTESTHELYFTAGCIKRETWNVLHLFRFVWEEDDE